MTLPAGKYIPPLDEKWLDTSITRIESTRNQEPHDRVAFIPRMIGYGGGMIAMERGIHNFGEFYRNPTMGMEGSLYGEQMLDMDVYALWRWANYLESVLGCGVEIRDSGQVIPAEGETAFNKVEDVENFETPSVDEVAKNWEVTGQLEAMGVVEKLTDGKYLHCYYNYDPVQAATVSCKDADLMFYWMAAKPDITHKLIRQTSETWINHTEVISSHFGPENRDCWQASVMSSNDTMSPDQWMEFYWPYAIDMQLKNLHNKGIRKNVFHPCGAHWPNEKAGHWTKLFKQIKEWFPEQRSTFGWPIRWKLWDVDPGEITRKYPTQTWWGPLDVHEYMVPMPNEVYEITKNFILECGNCPGGYMLGTACETGPDVRESNLHAVVQACRDFGQYDKNGELIAKGARPR
jgi:uroporphyrinogen decarboxylase